MPLCLLLLPLLPHTVSVPGLCLRLFLTLTLLVSLAHPAFAEDAPAVQWLQRLNATGTLVSAPAGMAVDAVGDVFVTGSSRIADGQYHARTAKYAAKNGALLWERASPGPPGYQANSGSLYLALDAAGDVYVAGHCSATAGTFESAWILKLSGATGTPLWEQRSPLGLFAFAVRVTPDGDVIIAGHTNGSDSESGNDFYAAKYPAAGGTPVWETVHRRRFLGDLLNSDESFSSLALDAAGNVIIGGETDYLDREAYTVKLSGADGSLVWDRVFHSQSLIPSDYCAEVAVDANGDVFTLIQTYDHPGGYDFYTIKYSGADGSVLWQKRDTLDDDSLEVPTSLVLDAAGNAIVAGHVYYLPEYNFTAYLVKHAAADGAVMWIARSPLEGNEFFRPDTKVWDAVVDANGDILLCGSKDERFTSTRIDVYGGKVSGVDGSFLWHTKSDGGVSGNEEAARIALMPDGRPVMAAWEDAVSQDNLVTLRFGEPLPLVTALSAASITTTSVTLRGRVNPRGVAAVARFEYGPTTAYGSTAAINLTNPEGTAAENVSFPVTGLNPGATVHWRLAAAPVADPSAVVTTADQVVTLPTVLQNWRMLRYGSSENAGAIADTADPDRDGVPNLVEWACGTQPFFFNPAPLLTVIAVNGGSQLIVTWPRSTSSAAAIAATPGASMGLEWSQSLDGPAAWSSAGITEEVAGEAAGIQTIRSVLPVPPAAPGAGDRRIFVRLRVANAR
jgi:hypothetical protein